MMILKGNVVTPEDFFSGEVVIRGERIDSVVRKGPACPDERWVLPGFIDLHLHGLGPWTVETAEGLCGMAEYAVRKGTTSICPTASCASEETLLAWLRTVRDLTRCPPPGAKIAGSHLEGPWLDKVQKGGMNPAQIREPDIREARGYLEAAQGTLRLLTIAPEHSGALEVVRLMKQAGVTVSCGHSSCPPSFLKQAVAGGVTQICHLFDSWDLPEDRGGVRQAAVTDLALIDDRLMKEIIMDGLHVPPELVVLARRAAGADHLIAITDAMQGAGLPSGRFFDNGVPYLIRDGDVARMEGSGLIVGSSLTMNRAFSNLVSRFGFTPVEAARVTAANPARQLGLAGITGELKEGLLADIAVLQPDAVTVEETYVNGVRFVPS